jgi:hypothetical protein
VGAGLPVVVIVFNRPGCTSSVLESLARFKPDPLFVVGDGPRPGRPEDVENVRTVRGLFDRLPWRCEVVRSMSDENMGCRKRVSSGLDWVFGQVEQAAILEDDIVPGESFLPFCEELLDRYRGDARVGSISATDFAAGGHRFQASYAFSRYNLFWGWATWRRAWRAYDDSLGGMASGDASCLDDVLRRTFTRWRERVYWRAVLRKVAAEEIDSWGYRWLFSCWKSGMLGVQPAASLVTNIGTGADATHTRSGIYGIKAAAPMRFPLVHPAAVKADRHLDRRIEDRLYSKSVAARAAWLWSRLRRAGR